MIDHDLVLTELTAVDQATLIRLHDRLEQRAEQSDLLDVAVRTIDSPVGPLLLAATSRGLVRIAYDREGMDAVLQRLANMISPRVLAAPRRLENAARQLDEYFSGRRRVFEFPLDLRLASGFRSMVLGYLTGIPYGRTQSYAEVAARFPVHKTGRTRYHYTIELPEPVSDDDARALNQLFGRRPE